MKKRDSLHLRPDEPTGLAFTRLYRRLRSIDRSHKPGSHYAARIQHKQAANHPRLRLVK